MNDSRTVYNGPIAIRILVVIGIAIRVVLVRPVLRAARALALLAKHSWTIYRRELAGLFFGPLAWVVLCLALYVNGFHFSGLYLPLTQGDVYRHSRQSAP